MSRYPDGITESDHLAHDMRVGRFPEQSSVEVFLQERGDGPLRVLGVSRMADNEQAVLVSFNRRPADDELRTWHDQHSLRPAP